MNRLAAEGKGVIVAENLAALTKLKLGDTVRTAPPRRARSALPVVGIIRDLSNQLGTIFIDSQALHNRYFGRRHGRRLPRLRQARRYARKRCGRASSRTSGRQRHMFVMLNREVRKFVDDMMNQWFGMTYLQVLVAVFVAVLGIVNTLTVSISDRRRELGVLRAVGGLRTRSAAPSGWRRARSASIGLIARHWPSARSLCITSCSVVQDDLSGMPLALPISRSASRCCWCR